MLECYAVELGAATKDAHEIYSHEIYRWVLMPLIVVLRSDQRLCSKMYMRTRESSSRSQATGVEPER